ncbi:MAG: hypothetical protein WA655_20720 [Candidatus Korobacteraceae bacterium]
MSCWLNSYYMATAAQNPTYLGAHLAWQAKTLPGKTGVVDPLRDPLNLFLAGCLSLLIICGTLAIRNDILDGFLLPVFACGVLIGPDMIAWLRGRLDTFDPLGILGAYGYFFFFLAPLLTVALDYHTGELPEPPDWLGWIGWMSVLNAFGLVIYLVSRNLIPARAPRTIWRVKATSFLGISSVVLPLTLAFQIYVFVKFGGILGFMTAFSNTEYDSFIGMGWQFLIAEMFPLFLGILFLVWKRDFLRQRSWWFLAGLVSVFFILKLLCGGLRGSRSNTIWGMFWLVGAIHLWVRRVPRRAIVAGLLFLAIFMYFYGFYKQAGMGVFDAIQDPGKLDTIKEKNGRTLTALLLGDMARSEIQSYLLYRLWAVGDYDYGYGTTYLEAFDIVIPKSIWPERPDGKVRKGTEALNGRDVYNARIFHASQVYGLAGEAMLNFSPIAAPLIFFVLAFVVAKSRGLMLADQDDARWLLVPILANGIVLLLSGDLDNLLMFFLGVGLGPLVLLRASSQIVPNRVSTGQP